MVETLQKSWNGIMVQHIQVIKINELDHIRIFCTSCKKVALETQTAELGDVLAGCKCPSCGANLEGDEELFSKFSDLFKILRKPSRDGQIEFILPAP